MKRLVDANDHFAVPFGIVVVLICSTEPARAYIGPEVGSLAVQGLIATFAVIAGFVSLTFSRLKNLLAGLVSRSELDDTKRTHDEKPAGGRD